MRSLLRLPIPMSRVVETVHRSGLRLLFVALFAALAHNALADCTSEVDAAFSKLRQMPAFRMETAIVNEQGMLRMSVDYVLPDRMHQTVETGTAAGTVELIVIGSEAWSNQGQGWAQLPENFANQVSAQMRLSLANGQSRDTDYECLGEQALEGVQYLAYRAQLPAVGKASDAKPNIQTVYIDKATGMPVRNIVTAPDAPDKRLFDGTFQSKQGLKIEKPVAH